MGSPKKKKTFFSGAGYWKTKNNPKKFQTLKKLQGEGGEPMDYKKTIKKN